MGVILVCVCVLGRVLDRACVFVFCWGEGGESGEGKEERTRPPPCLKYHSRFSVDPPLSSRDPSPLRHHSHPHTRAMSSAALRLPPTPRLAAVRRCRRACVAPVAAAPGPGKDMATDLRARGRDFMAVRSVFLVFFGGGGGWGRILGPCVAGGCKEHASAMAGAMAAAAGEAELIGREKKKKRQRQGRGHVGPGAGAGRTSGRAPVPGRCCRTSTMSTSGVGGPGEAACRPAGGGSFFPHPPTPPPATEKAGRPFRAKKKRLSPAPPPQKRGPSRPDRHPSAPPPNAYQHWSRPVLGGWKGRARAGPPGRRHLTETQKKSAPHPFFSVDPRPFFLFPALFSDPRPHPHPPLSTPLPPPPPITAPRRPLRRRGRPGRHHLLRPAGPGPGDRPVHHRRRHGGRPGRGRRPFLGRAGGAVREGNGFF